MVHTNNHNTPKRQKQENADISITLQGRLFLMRLSTGVQQKKRSDCAEKEYKKKELEYRNKNIFYFLSVLSFPGKLGTSQFRVLMFCLVWKGQKVKTMQKMESTFRGRCQAFLRDQDRMILELAYETENTLGKDYATQPKASK